MRYLYIDDENDASVESLIRGFNDQKIIDVERLPLERHLDFSRLKEMIIDKFSTNKAQGLLIDLRLDGTGPDRLDFSAISITSELRAMAARREIISVPIVLCSTIEKINETYNSDKTSHDLFDYTFRKSEHPDFQKFSNKLFSLAHGYINIKEVGSVERVFGREDLNLLDNRIFDRFFGQDVIVPYDYAHFTIKTLFHCTNPLVKETILGARLGIDIEQSGDSWRKLKEEVFSDAQYVGLFSDGWSRWWADRIIFNFKRLSDKKLQFLPAKERVEILEEKTGIKGLVAAKPIKHNKSTEYWTICEGYKKPLDPLEGFKIQTSQELKPWQESKYLSLDAVLERIGKEKGLKVHHSENNRLDEIIKALK